MKFTRSNTRAFSLVEMLVVIAVIGILGGVAIPIIADIYEKSQKAKDTVNAKNIERMSASLASLGVAHVIPDSMGGVEATARLLREGVKVPEGPMKDEIFILSGMDDEDIEDAGKLLRVQYDMEALRLVFEDSSTFHFAIPSACLYCCHPVRSPARIESFSVG